MPEKILNFLPEKKTNQPEKKFENLPEKTSKCPRKNFQKWARKTISAREKKQKKYQKPFSRALFIFSGKKKKPCPKGLCEEPNFVQNYDHNHAPHQGFFFTHENEKCPRKRFLVFFLGFFSGGKFFLAHFCIFFSRAV